jgi:hypothetical protein
MSQTFWEMDSAEGQSVVAEPQPEPEQLAQSEQSVVPVPLAVSADDFSALEERIVRAVELVKRERQLRTDAEERAAKAEALITEQSPVVDELRGEIRALRAERDQVRQRVERLLAQLDALEL